MGELERAASAQDEFGEDAAWVPCAFRAVVTLALASTRALRHAGICTHARADRRTQDLSVSVASHMCCAPSVCRRRRVRIDLSHSAVPCSLVWCEVLLLYSAPCLLCACNCLQLVLNSALFVVSSLAPRRSGSAPSSFEIAIVIFHSPKSREHDSRTP